MVKMMNYTPVVKNESMPGGLENNYNSSHPETVIINCVLNALLMLICIPGNALVLAAILRTPSLRSPSNVFLCSLAVSDLLVGLIVLPVYIANALINPGRIFLSRLLQARDLLYSLVSGVSLATMTAISVDRFLALRYHMRYPSLMTTEGAKYTSAILWFVSTVYSCLSIWNRSIFLVSILVGMAHCLLISSFSYIRIYQIVRHHQLQIQVQQEAVRSLNAEHNLNIMQSKKSATNTFIYYICMIVCYIPPFLSILVFVNFNKHWKIGWNFADTVVFMNSAINPFFVLLAYS